jgi:hypothetical protein
MTVRVSPTVLNIAFLIAYEKSKLASDISLRTIVMSSSGPSNRSASQARECMDACKEVMLVMKATAPSFEADQPLRWM